MWTGRLQQEKLDESNACNRRHIAGFRHRLRRNGECATSDLQGLAGLDGHHHGETAIEDCKSKGYNVSAHVLGREGQIIVAIRNPAAGFGTFENSMKKAYTARTTRAPSGKFAEAVKGNPNAASSS